MHKYHTIDEYFQKRKIERMYNCSVVYATGEGSLGELMGSLTHKFTIFCFILEPHFTINTVFQNNTLDKKYKTLDI